MFLSLEKSRVQRPALPCIFNDALPDIRKPDPFYPGCGTLQITRLLTVELHKGYAIFFHLFRCGNLAQQVGRPDLYPAITADMQLPTGIHRDHAKILDSGLGTIAWTTGYRHLDLVRR